MLFLGGKTLAVPPGANETDVISAWDQAQRNGIASHFIRQRFIPDFYERLLTNPDRHILTWQTREAVELAQRIHPYLLRGTNLNEDKALFRRMASHRGIPDEAIHTAKNPMQVSTGGVDGIVHAARRALADDYGEKTYSDPTTEPPEFTIARLYLQRLSNA